MTSTENAQDSSEEAINSVDTKLSKLTISSLQITSITLKIHQVENEENTKLSKKKTTIFMNAPVEDEVIKFFEAKGITVNYFGNIYYVSPEGSGYRVDLEW